MSLWHRSDFFWIFCTYHHPPRPPRVHVYGSSMRSGRRSSLRKMLRVFIDSGSILAKKLAFIHYCASKIESAIRSLKTGLHASLYEKCLFFNPYINTKHIPTLVTRISFQKDTVYSSKTLRIQVNMNLQNFI